MLQNVIPIALLAFAAGLDARGVDQDLSGDADSMIHLKFDRGGNSVQIVAPRESTK